MRRHSVCVALDIDDFKQVNDTYGHIEGDTLLHEVGKVLRSSFREATCWVAWAATSSCCC